MLGSCKRKFIPLKKKCISAERGPQLTYRRLSLEVFLCQNNKNVLFLTFFQYFNLFFAAFFVLNTWRGHKGQTLTSVLTAILLRPSQTESYVAVVRNGSNPLNILLDNVFCLVHQKWHDKNYTTTPEASTFIAPNNMKFLHGTNNKLRILIFREPHGYWGKKCSSWENNACKTFILHSETFSQSTCSWALVLLWVSFKDIFG